MDIKMPIIKIDANVTCNKMCDFCSSHKRTNKTINIVKCRKIIFDKLRKYKYLTIIFMGGEVTIDYKGLNLLINYFSKFMDIYIHKYICRKGHL